MLVPSFLWAQHGLVAVISNEPTFVGSIDTETNQANGSFTAGRAPLNAIAVSPDGSRAYILQSSIPAIDVVALPSGETITSIAFEFGTQGGFAVSPDGSRLFVVLQNGESEKLAVATIDTTSNTVLQTVVTPDEFIANITGQLTFSPDGSKLYVPSPGATKLYVLDVATGNYETAINLPLTPNGIATSADGLSLVIAGPAGGLGGDTEAAILDPTSFAVRTRFGLPGIPCPVTLSVDANASQFYMLTSASCFLNEADTIVSVNVQARSVTAQSPVFNFATALLLLPNGELYVAESSGVWVVSTPSLDPVASIGQPGSVSGIAGAASATAIYAVNSSDAALAFTAVATGRITNKLPIGVAYEENVDRAIKLAVPRDGSRSFVTSSIANTLTVIDNVHEKVLAYDQLFNSPNLMAAASPLGPVYTLSTTNFPESMPALFAAIEPSTGELLRSAPLTTQPDGPLAVSPDGSQLWASDSATKSIMVFSSSTFEQLGAIDGKSALSIAFSPDSTHCYIGFYSEHGDILDINTATLEISRTIHTAPGPISALVVSPDGQTLYAFGDDTLITVNLPAGSTTNSIPIDLYHVMLGLSDDGSEVYMASGEEVVIYDTLTGALVTAPEFPSAIEAVGFTSY